MSHAHGRHDSCNLRLLIRLFLSIHRALAGGVTDMGVGSGALLGLFRSGRDRRPHRTIALKLSMPLSFFAEATPEYLDCLTRGMTVSASPAPCFTTSNRCRRFDLNHL